MKNAYAGKISPKNLQLQPDEAKPHDASISHRLRHPARIGNDTASAQVASGGVWETVKCQNDCISVRIY